MNVIVRTASPEIAPQPADALDHLAEALFHKMGTDGVYARTALYEDMVERLAALITRHREPGTEVMRFPPVMNRGQLEKSGYLKSFPNLLGCVCGLRAAARCLWAACASMSPPTASAANLPGILTGYSRSGCANMSASAARTMSLIFASAGWYAPRRSHAISA